MKILVCFLFFNYFNLVQCQLENCNKKKIFVECVLTTDNFLMSRELSIEPGKVEIIDKDSSNNVCRLFNFDKWGKESNCLGNDSLAVDYLFNAFYVKNTSNIELYRLGKSYSLKRIKGDLYYVKFDFNSYIWEGQIECVENILVTARISKKKKTELGYIVLSHENLLVKKIKLRK